MPADASASESVSAALVGHRITALTTFEVSSRYPRRIGRNARLGSHGTGPTSTALAITTGDGVTGWGLASGR